MTALYVLAWLFTGVMVLTAMAVADQGKNKGGALLALSTALIPWSFVAAVELISAAWSCLA